MTEPKRPALGPANAACSNEHAEQNAGRGCWHYWRGVLQESVNADRALFAKHSRLMPDYIDKHYGGNQSAFARATIDERIGKDLEEDLIPVCEVPTFVDTFVDKSEVRAMLTNDDVDGCMMKRDHDGMRKPCRERPQQPLVLSEEPVSTSNEDVLVAIERLDAFSVLPGQMGSCNMPW